MDFSAILLHPDKEEIITKLLTGVLPKKISQWLKLKYSQKEQHHLQISIKLLDEYNRTHVGNLMEHLQRDIAVVKSPDPTGEMKVLAKSLLNNKTYRERLLELANSQLDIKKMIKDLVLIINERVEQVFDKIQENPTNFKADYVLIKYFELLLNATEKFDKIVNNAPDQIIQHNVSVKMVDQYTAALQEAVRKTLAQIDTESAMLFVEILGQELRKLESPVHTPTIKEVEGQAKILQELTFKVQGENEDE